MPVSHCSARRGKIDGVLGHRPAGKPMIAGTITHEVFRAGL